MLTTPQIRAAIAAHKASSLKAGAGLTLRIMSTGTAFWQGRKMIDGQAQSVTHGNFPDMSYRQAEAAHKKWLAGLAPKPRTVSAYTFREAFQDWARIKSKTARSFAEMELRIKAHLLPVFGKIAMEDLTAPMIIDFLRKLEDAGTTETLKKLCGYIRQIAVLAINTGRVDRMHDLTHLTEAFVFKRKTPRPAVTPEALPDLFYSLESRPRLYGLVWQLFMASWYTLARPREIAWAKWEWYRPDEEIIIFPEEIMKTGRPHVCPVSTQLSALFAQLPRVSEYVFTSPCRRNGDNQPINKESVRMMLKREGMQGKQTAHGIRAVGRTWMALNNVPDKVAEACLAHSTGSEVELAYKRYNYLNERREVMQRWCDYVDACRAQAHERIRG